MKRFVNQRILSIAAVALAFVASAAGPVDYVNTLMGSQSSHSFSSGNTYPAVALPWGMNFWTPQTGRMGDGWTYTYDASAIRGLKQTHQPSPWINDYGQFSLMPVTGGLVFDEDARASHFSHKAEKTTPYYYSVYLADHDVVAEMAPTERAAMMRFTFPQTDSATVVIDAFDGGSSVTVQPDRQRITGYTTKNSGGVPEGFRNYFIVEFDRPFDFFASVADGEIRRDATHATADHVGAIAGFSSTDRGDVVHARIASSFISIEQAERNLHELDGLNFDGVADAARDRWNDVLGRIEIADADVPDRLRTFYSCLYRSVLFPRSFYEVDESGSPVHYSPYNGEVRSGYMFTDTGFWDTFRALFPLLNLLYPSVNERIQAGLVNAYDESGFLPEWASPGHRGCMVGNNSASVVADAWLSGLRGYDVERLWQAVTTGAHAVHPEVNSTGRLGYELYDSLGYVPCDAGINESAARTLEYAYDDWCIYRLGTALGKSDSILAPYAASALNYRNIFDRESSLMRGRRADGSFQSPFNPLKWGDAFTEGNALHYTWSVFHDPQGLADMMGGRTRFAAMLDTVFAIPPMFDESYYGFVIHEIREMQVMNMGNYAHGNQPVQHMIYLYNWAGEPWKAQRRVREAMDKLYTATPDGYCGDEDNGQTSAWYVFSALGFYPVCPGSGQYAIGSPLFRQVRIRLENGEDILISAPDNATDRPYIGSMEVNGVGYDRNWLDADSLRRGATILFRMQSEPDLTRGTSPESAPYSFSR